MTIPPDRLIQAAVAESAEPPHLPCLLYTSDAADERSSVDLGGRRIIKKKIDVTRTRHLVLTS